MKLSDFIRNPFTAKKKAEAAKAQEVEVRKTQQEGLEKLHSAFGHLVSNLEGINDNLNKHIEQQQELLERFESIPEITKQQSALIEQTLEQLSEQTIATNQFTEVVAKIPDESLRQTKELEQIKERALESNELEKSFLQEVVSLNRAMKRQSRILSFIGLIAFVVLAALVAAGYYLLRQIL